MPDYTATSWRATPSFGTERSSFFYHPVRRYKIQTIDSKGYKGVKFIENPRDFIPQTNTATFKNLNLLSGLEYHLYSSLLRCLIYRSFRQRAYVGENKKNINNCG